MRRRLYGLLAVLAGVAVFVGTHEGDADDAALALPVAHAQAISSLPGRRPPALGGTGSAQARRVQLTGALARALEADAKAVEWPSLPETARRSWEGASAPSSAVQVTPHLSPTPPEVPFQWIGLWDQPSAASGAPPAPVAIISASHGTRLAHAGDVLEDDWKVDRISGDQIQLTYLPLQVRQTLSMNTK